MAKSNEQLTQIVPQFQSEANVQVSPDLMASGIKEEERTAAVRMARGQKQKLAELRAKEQSQQEEAIEKGYARIFKFSEADLSSMLRERQEKLRAAVSEVQKSWGEIAARFSDLSEDVRDSIAPTEAGGHIVEPTPEKAAVWLAQWSHMPKGFTLSPTELAKRARLNQLRKIVEAFVASPLLKRLTEATQYVNKAEQELRKARAEKAV